MLMLSQNVLQRFYIMKEKLKNSGKFEIYFGDGTTSIIEEQNASSISLFISVFLFQFLLCFQKSGLASSMMVHFSICKFNKKKCLLREMWMWGGGVHNCTIHTFFSYLLT